MTSYQSALEAALEAMRKASRWIYYRRLAGGDPISEEEELLFRAAAQAKEALQRQEQEPVAWDDRPLLAHCLEAVNAACSAWSDVRNLNSDIDGGKCAAAAALERIAKDRIKELATQCASPPKPEKQAARRLTDEELFEQRVSWVFSCMNGLTKDQVRDILRNQLRPPSPPCGE